MGRNYKEGKERNLYILTLGFLLLHAQPKVLSTNKSNHTILKDFQGFLCHFNLVANPSQTTNHHCT